MVKSGDPEKVRNYRASIYPFKRSFDDVCAVVRGIDEIYDTMKTIKTLYIINPEDMVKDAVSKTVQDMHRHTPEYLRNLTTVPRINNMMRDAKKFKENGEPIPTDFFDFLEDEGLKPK
jgi:predicted nucleic acid-binding protein